MVRRSLLLLICLLLVNMLSTSVASAAIFAVAIADSKLIEAVREAIGKPLGVLPEKDMSDLTTLHADFRGIVSLAGIEKMTGLKELRLIGNNVECLDPLLDLPNLRSVDLRFNPSLDTSEGSPARKVIDALTERGCKVYYGKASVRVEYTSFGGEPQLVCEYDGGKADVLHLIMASVTYRSQAYHLRTTEQEITIQAIEKARPPLPIEGVFYLTGSALPSGWKWEEMDRDIWMADSGTKGIVLIVHGWSSGHKHFTSLATELAQDRWTVYAVDYICGERVEDIGAALADLIDRHVPSGQKLSIVAHSMGGLVSRSAIEQHGIADRVDKLITLGTPHNGIPIEYFLNGHNLYLQILPDIDFDTEDSSIRVLAPNRTWFYLAARAAYTWRTGKQKPFGLDILDMAKLTSFLDNLNTSSPVETVYFQIAGTVEPPVVPESTDAASRARQLADLSDEVFGALSHWAYNLQLPNEKPTDGVVPLTSATLDLSGEQPNGAYIDWEERVFPFPVNHRAFHLSADVVQRLKQMLDSTTVAGTVMSGRWRGSGNMKIALSGWFLDPSAPDGVVHGVTVRTNPDGSFSRPGFLGSVMVTSEKPDERSEQILTE